MSDTHSVHVDYLELITGPRPHLWLSYDYRAGTLCWEILNANRHDELYSRAATLDHAIAFVRAAERNGDATVDEDSVEYARMLRLRLERLGEPTAERAIRAPVSQAALAGAEPASPSNVVPIRRHLEPHDCPPRPAPHPHGAPPAGADSTPAEGA